MKRATAVIGAAFGDEGKGLMTDYLVRQGDPAKTLVVRYCGGAQAGHTVVTPEGLRHVFHHYGSGTLAGAGTFLADQFLVNPAAWWQEFLELSRKCTLPLLHIDSGCRVTTPWDMAANQAIEKKRGEERHGSCGMGVHHTMHRHDRWPLFASDLWLPRSRLKEKCNQIRDYWGMDWDHFMERFLDECQELTGYATMAIPSYPKEFESVVYEGSQGLLLDQDAPYFPHVTHAKTGLKNVVESCRRSGISRVDALYVTRSYMTRHGAGPLPGERADLSYPDDTNVENPWQGKLRFAPLDIGLLSATVGKDTRSVLGRGVEVWPQWAVTHMDQQDTEVASRVRFTSWGPTHKDIRKVRD